MKGDGKNGYNKRYIFAFRRNVAYFKVNCTFELHLDINCIINKCMCIFLY